MGKDLSEGLDLEVVDRRRNGDNSERERLEAGRFFRRFSMSKDKLYQTFYDRLCKARDYEL